MKNNCYIVKLLACFILAFTIISLASPTASLAQVPEDWDRIDTDAGTPGRCTVSGVATLQGFECIFTNITRILTPLAGLLLFMMLIVGSFQLMTASGDPKKNQKAKATLTYAIIGLVIFLGIWLVLLLIKAITGVDVLKFEIPG